MATERERAAIERDVRDITRLENLDLQLQATLQAIRRYAGPLEHPRRKWHPDDLIAELEAARHDIAAELEALKGPVVIEDSE